MVAEMIRTVVLRDVRTPPRFGARLDFPLQETRDRVAENQTLVFEVWELGAAQTPKLMGVLCQHPVIVGEVRDRPAGDSPGVVPGQPADPGVPEPAGDWMPYTVDGFLRRFGQAVLDQILAEPAALAAAGRRRDGPGG